MRLNLKVVNGKRRSGRMTEVALFNEDGSPVNERKFYDIAPEVTEEAGWVAAGWDSSYIDGDNLVFSFDIDHAALALDDNTLFNLLTLPEELMPAAYVQTFVRVNDGSFHDLALCGVNPDGLIKIQPFSDRASGHVNLELYSVRYPLADVVAARVFLNSL